MWRYYLLYSLRQTCICMHIPWGVHKHSSYTHKWTQSSSIYKKLWSPQISLRRDQIFADLFGFYLHIHLSFFRFASKCVSACTQGTVRALCKQCLLRRWIKQQAHLICTTLRGKCAHTHRLAYSIKIISIIEAILRGCSKPFFPRYNLFYSYPRTHTSSYKCVHTLLKATLPGGHTALT